MTAGGTGAGEGRGDFLADVAGFADADDDNFAAPLQRFDDGFNRAVKRFVEQRADGFERGHFDVENFAGFGEVAHGGSLPATDGEFQPRSSIITIRRWRRIAA